MLTAAASVPMDGLGGSLQPSGSIGLSGSREADLSAIREQACTNIDNLQPDFVKCCFWLGSQSRKEETSRSDLEFGFIAESVAPERWKGAVKQYAACSIPSVDIEHTGANAHLDQGTADIAAALPVISAPGAAPRVNLAFTPDQFVSKLLPEAAASKSERPIFNVLLDARPTTAYVNYPLHELKWIALSKWPLDSLKELLLQEVEGRLKADINPQYQLKYFSYRVLHLAVCFTFYYETRRSALPMLLTNVATTDRILSLYNDLDLINQNTCQQLSNLFTSIITARKTQEEVGEDTYFNARSIALMFRRAARSIPETFLASVTFVPIATWSPQLGKACFPWFAPNTDHVCAQKTFELLLSEET